MKSFGAPMVDQSFDRQTDGRTGSFLIVRPRLHSMQRGIPLQI